MTSDGAGPRKGARRAYRVQLPQPPDAFPVRPATSNPQAHPGLHRERLLTGVVGRISTPETVESEVLEKAKRDPRFRRVTGVWAKMRPDWIELLSDNERIWRTFCEGVRRVATVC